MGKRILRFSHADRHAAVSSLGESFHLSQNLVIELDPLRPVDPRRQKLDLLPDGEIERIEMLEPGPLSDSAENGFRKGRSTVSSASVDIAHHGLIGAETERRFANHLHFFLRIVWKAIHGNNDGDAVEPDDLDHFSQVGQAFFQKRRILARQDGVEGDSGSNGDVAAVDLESPGGDDHDRRIGRPPADPAFDIEKFLERANPEQKPDIFYLEKFEEDNKIKIYYNKKEVSFKFYSIRGALCMLMFGDEINDIERYKDFDPEDYNEDKKEDGYNENCDYSYKISIKLIYKDYIPHGEKKVNIEDLTRLIYYQGDWAKIDRADKKEKIKYNDRIYRTLFKINTIAKRKDNLGIDLFSVVKSGKFSHDGKVKVKKSCKILDSEMDS